MVTVHRAHGLRVVIFVDDHEPAHVHVFGDGRAEIRRSMGVVREQQAYLLKRWSEIHG
jgi:hypothetical protein